jgi:CHAD domain-containing protein
MAEAATCTKRRDEHLEREVKLEAGVAFSLPDLRDLLPGGIVRSLPEQRLHSVYVDTADLRLIRSGVTLRHRKDQGSDGSEAWTLKLPDSPRGLGLWRREIEVAGKWGSVPAELDSLVRAFRRTAPLQPVARLVTQRRRALLCGPAGEPLLEVDDDVVSVMDGRRVAARFREVEAEATPATTPQLLSRAVAVLEAAGAHTSPDQRPKVVRALGPRALEPPDVVPVAIGPSSPIGEVTRSVIAAGLLRMIGHDPDVRCSEDAEAVHQLRVGTRRLRSDLRTFRLLLPPDWYEAVTSELRWLAALLGAVRDADVLHERLAQAAVCLGPPDTEIASRLIARLDPERLAARAELRAALDQDRYTTLLERLAEAAQELPPLPGAPPDPSASGPDDAGSDALARDAPGRDDPAAKVAPRLVARPWRHLAGAVRALEPEPSEEELHQVRIHAKRLRYACEAVAAAAGRPAARMAELAADLQGVLGDFHDAVVAEAWLRRAAAGVGSAEGVAAGLLIAAQRNEAEACRQRWPRCWAQLDRKKVHAWLET